MGLHDRLFTPEGCMRRVATRQCDAFGMFILLGYEMHKSQAEGKGRADTSVKNICGGYILYLLRIRLLITMKYISSFVLNRLRALEKEYHINKHTIRHQYPPQRHSNNPPNLASHTLVSYESYSHQIVAM